MRRDVYRLLLLVAVKCGLVLLPALSARTCTSKYGNIGAPSAFLTQKFTYEGDNAPDGRQTCNYRRPYQGPSKQYLVADEAIITASKDGKSKDNVQSHIARTGTSDSSATAQFIAGIEAHIQLAIPHKIFCHCKSTASCFSSDEEPKQRDKQELKPKKGPESRIDRCVNLYHSLKEVQSSVARKIIEERNTAGEVKTTSSTPEFEDYIARYNNTLCSENERHIPTGKTVNPRQKQPDAIHRINEFVCPICRGEAGTLPLLSPLAVLYGLAACHVFSCKPSHSISFERKVYSYADLPKRYQLTQVRDPIGKDGHIILGNDKRIKIQRLNLEEDSARNLATSGEEETIEKIPSLDYNRCGIGLIELVTEACEVTLPELLECCSLIYARAVDSGLCKGWMHEGNVRFDINLSTPAIGTRRVEIKNLNSFRRIRRAVEQCLSSSWTSERMEPTETETEPDSSSDERHSRSWDHILADVFGRSCESSDKSPVGATLAWKGNKTGATYIRHKDHSSSYMNPLDTNIPRMTISDDLLSAVQFAMSLSSGYHTACNVANHPDGRPDNAGPLSGNYPQVPEDLLNVIGKTDSRISLFQRLERRLANPILAAKWLVNYIIPLISDLDKVDPEKLAGLLLAVDAKRINVDTAKRMLSDFIASGMNIHDYMRCNHIGLLSEKETHEFIDAYLDRNATKLPTGEIAKSELTRLVREIVGSSGDRLSYSLVRNYLAARLGQSDETLKLNR